MGEWGVRGGVGVGGRDGGRWLGLLEVRRIGDAGEFVERLHGACCTFLGDDSKEYYSREADSETMSVDVCRKEEVHLEC